MAWLLLSHLNIDPNMLQTPNDSIEDIEMNIKIEFADLVKDAKSVGGFFPSRRFRVGRNDVA